LSEDSGRYPVKMPRYCQSVGRLLPHRAGQIFKELGFRTWVRPDQSNGIDLSVYDNEDHLIVAVEVLNWSSHSEMSIKRKNSIIDNLSKFNCRRLLLYTTLKNERILGDSSIYGISLLKLDYQLQPLSFYNFFAKKNQVEYRRADSREAIEYIRSKITHFLQSSDIEIHTLPFESSQVAVTI
jgi:uncharacterized protein YqjF (DUF2071 family)